MRYVVFCFALIPFALAQPEGMGWSGIWDIEDGERGGDAPN